MELTLDQISMTGGVEGGSAGNKNASLNLFTRLRDRPLTTLHSWRGVRGSMEVCASMN